MTRSPQAVFTAHKTALAQWDVVAILQDYREDAVLLTSQGAMEGRSRVEAFYSQALAALPQMEINYTSAVYAGDALLVQWTHSQRQAASLMESTLSYSQVGRSGSRHQLSLSSRWHPLSELQGSSYSAGGEGWG